MADEWDIHVKDHTDEVMAAITEKVNLALNLMGEVVEGYAKEDCPVDTGLLRNSITHTLGGAPVSHSYHASYGENRDSSGRRYGAGSKKAGSVKIGALSGTIGSASDHACYVGTNVEYAPYVEFGDRFHHNVGKAHFLRDAAQDHVDELKDVAQKTLKTI